MTPRAIVHVDLDAFYASVEQRDAPELRGKPVIVGGHPQRGVVLAASYEVRPFGVKSAMPMAQAVRRAPQAIVVPPRFAAYVAASEAVFGIFHDVTPEVEPLSLDEAFLDVTASVSLFGPPATIARQIRRRIFDEVGLAASAGIASVKFVAKIASDHAKPNGQREVPPDGVIAYLAPLPVSRLWGVGPKTEAVLLAAGLRTIGDVAAVDPTWLVRTLGDLGRHLRALAQGHDGRPVVPDRHAKSVGAEDTFEEDVRDPARLRVHLHAQALRVARRLRRAGLFARGVELKLKFADFQSLSRHVRLDPATDDGHALFAAVGALLAKVPLTRAVRLTGVSAHELTPSAGQLSLFDAPAQAERRRLNATLDDIAARFGKAAVVTADLVEGGASAGHLVDRSPFALRSDDGRGSG